MALSSFILKMLAKREFRKSLIMQSSALQNQAYILQNLISRGQNSLFFKNIQKNITNYSSFKKFIPITNYESIRPYIQKISNGESGVLTQGKPKYFAITSGTTSGTKYIPLTRKMMSFQTQAIKELLLLYAYQVDKYVISNIGMMFIQGSPELKYYNKMPYAKLSGISARHVPFFLKKNRYPSMKTNSISNWEKKIKHIVKETHNKDMRIIGGIPPWVITYFNELLNYTGAKTAKEIFPNLELYIHGGTSFESYKRSFLKTSGKINTLEVYPASEGFFAYQNDLADPSLLLLTNHGVFYEFLSLEDFKNGIQNRICLAEVELGVNYIMLVSTVSGLWAYNTGDTVRFVSKSPYKILFSGRSSQYCSAFGEHVIEKEVQAALLKTVKVWGGVVSEFLVCPKINPESSKSHHQWFIEFITPPKDLSAFEKCLNVEMENQNIYYKDLIKSNIIQSLKLILVKRGGFDDYMKSIGKFGGQNKCPHLCNDSKIGNFLIKKRV